MTVSEMVETALVVCPFHPTPQMMHETAKETRLSQRDDLVLQALCAMYLKGRVDANSEAAAHAAEVHR